MLIPLSFVLAGLSHYLAHDDAARYVGPVRAFTTRDLVVVAFPGKEADVYAQTAGLVDRNRDRRVVVSQHKWLPVRFHVAHGRLWTSYVFDFSKDYKGGGDSLYRDRLEDLTKQRPGEPPDERFTGFRVWFAAAAPVTQARFLGRYCEFPHVQYYDYLPVAKDAVLLFAMTNARGRLEPAGRGGDVSASIIRISDEEASTPRWSFTVYKCSEGPASDEPRMVHALQWEKVETIAVRFTEPFQVAAAGGDYYFLTASGKAYRAAKPDKGKERVPEPIWDDPERPIRALLTDAEAGRTFCFCRPAKGQDKASYFELAAKPAPLPCPADGVRALDPKDPMPAVLKLARFLKEEKKIKGE